MNRLAHWTGRPIFWLALAAVVYTPFINTTVGQGNVASDLAAIESLVERGTFYIGDSTFADTIDKMKTGDRFFSQKSPVFHLAAAVPYAALRAAGFTLREDLALCLRALTFLFVVLPMGWLLWTIYDHPWMRVQPERRRLALTLVFAFGSLLTPFAVTFNHYIPAAACLMTAVNALMRAELASPAPEGRVGASVGLWTSASLACDVPPAFLFGLGAAAFFLLRSRRRLIGFLAGGLPLVALYAALNFGIYGSPLPPNLHEAEMLYYDGSYWNRFREAAERGEPTYYQASWARRIFHGTLGHKGLYWMMPLLALATAASAWLAGRRARGWRWAAAWTIFPLVALGVAMRWAFDLSGGAYGIRHVFAALPPLYCVLAHPELPEPGRAIKTLAGVAAAWGIGVAALGVPNPWSHNTISAIPPLENAARLALRRPEALPTDWIDGLIAATSLDLANAWLDVGLEWMRHREWEKASEALRRAIAAEPDAPLPYYHLGIALDRADRPAAAIDAYQKLLELQPDNVGAWNNLGLFALRAGRLELARSAYARSQELAPHNASADWGELTIAEIEGRADPDSPRLREALERHPRDPRLRDLARRWQRGNKNPPRHKGED